MRILVIDTEACSLDFCLRAQAHGHQVRLYIPPQRDGSRNRTADGMIQRVPDWTAHCRWADLIVPTDNIKHMAALGKLKAEGYPVFAGDAVSAAWELDRDKGMKVLERAGVPTLPSTTFNDYDEAIRFVLKTKKRYVSKPSGEADKALSYVSKGPDDMAFMLGRWKKLGKLKNPFILQEFCPGVEMAVGGWFGPGGFCAQWCENWEFKKLMNDDLGPNTGEQGTVLRYTPESRLADMMLKPVEGMLHGIDYVGYIDMNCIIDEHGQPWPLEWTMRFGWPLTYIQQALHRGDPAEWMVDLVDGHDLLRVSPHVSCGVVMAIPDYPYNKRPPAEYDGFPLYGVELKDALSDVHLACVGLGEAPVAEGSTIKTQEVFVTAGTYVATCTGTAATVDGARTRAYKAIEKIRLPNSPMYRTDIGCRLEKQLPKLQRHGFATGMRYGD